MLLRAPPNARPCGRGLCTSTSATRSATTTTTRHTAAPWTPGAPSRGALEAALVDFASWALEELNERKARLYVRAAGDVFRGGAFRAAAAEYGDPLLALQASGLFPHARPVDDITISAGSRRKTACAMSPPQRLAKAEGFLYSDDAAGREQCLADFRAMLADIGEKVAPLFDLTPEAACKARRARAPARSRDTHTHIIRRRGASGGGAKRRATPAAL